MTHRHIEFPVIGSGIDRVRVIRWVKQPRDRVVAGEPLLEFEVPEVEAVCELTSPYSGMILDILVWSGDISIGVRIATIVVSQNTEDLDRMSSMHSTHVGLHNLSAHLASEPSLGAHGASFVAPLHELASISSQFRQFNLLLLTKEHAASLQVLIHRAWLVIRRLGTLDLDLTEAPERSALLNQLREVLGLLGELCERVQSTDPHVLANPDHLKSVRHGAEAIAAWRRANPSTRLLLGSTDLSGTDLSGADLSNADLCQANLSCSDLTGADLTVADLKGAILDNATLIRAILRRTDLTKASLLSADLTETVIDRCELSGTKLGGAIVQGTIFARVDLSLVQGLLECEFQGDSSIDFPTSSTLPRAVRDKFLRGCGLPDEFVEQFPAILSSISPLEFYSVFICHTSMDAPFARKLHRDLQMEGVRCWLDLKDLAFGAVIHEEIDKAIRLYDKVLLVCSEHSLSSPWVQYEIQRTLEREQEIGRTVLIPLSIDDYLLSERFDSPLKRSIIERLVADFTGWQDTSENYEKSCRRLVLSLSAERG